MGGGVRANSGAACVPSHHFHWITAGAHFWCTAAKVRVRSLPISLA